VVTLLNRTFIFESYTTRLVLKTNTKKPCSILELSLKALKNSWFGKVFWPTFEIIE
jgi:hypothetical protein